MALPKIIKLTWKNLAETNTLAYFTQAISYTHIIFMKMTNGEYATNFVFLIADVRAKKARVFIPRKSNICDQEKSSSCTRKY